MSRPRRFKPPQASTRKRVKAPHTEGIDTDNMPPAFSFQYMDYHGRHCLSRCTNTEKADLADTLLKLSQLNWKDIKSVNRKKLGLEIIAAEAIRATSPSEVPEDVKFMAFRFSGMKPMVGFRKKQVYYIIWLDRSFSLYGH